MKIYSLLLYLIFITEIHGTEMIRRYGDRYIYLPQRTKLNSEQDTLEAQKIIRALSKESLEAQNIINEFSIPNAEQIMGTNGRAALSAFFKQKTKISCYEIAGKSDDLSEKFQYESNMLFLLAIKKGCNESNDDMHYNCKKQNHE